MSIKKTVLRRSRKQWQEIIITQQAGGESISEYCRTHNINPKSFYAWRKRLGGAGKIPKPTGFFQVESEHPGQEKVLTIQTPGGYCLQIPEGISEPHVRNILSVVALIT